MKNFIANNWFKLIVVFAALLIGFSVCYYFVIRPTINQTKLKKCYNDIANRNSVQVKEWCKIDNRELGNDGLCQLGSTRNGDIKQLEEETKYERGLCFKLYPQN